MFVGPLPYPLTAVLALRLQQSRMASLSFSNLQLLWQCLVVTAGATLGSAKIAGSWLVRRCCDLPRDRVASISYVQSLVADAM